VITGLLDEGMSAVEVGGGGGGVPIGEVEPRVPQVRLGFQKPQGRSAADIEGFFEVVFCTVQIFDQES